MKHKFCLKLRSKSRAQLTSCCLNFKATTFLFPSFVFRLLNWHISALLKARKASHSSKTFAIYRCGNHKTQLFSVINGKIYAVFLGFSIKYFSFSFCCCNKFQGSKSEKAIERKWEKKDVSKFHRQWLFVCFLYSTLSQRSIATLSHSAPNNFAPIHHQTMHINYKTTISFSCRFN